MRVEIIYKLVTRVIKYFFSLIDLWKVGLSWISRKGVNLRKKRGWSRKGGMNPLTNYEETLNSSLGTLLSASKFIFLAFAFLRILSHFLTSSCLGELLKLARIFSIRQFFLFCVPCFSCCKFFVSFCCLVILLK